jgi:hypothetical protein
LLSLQYLLLMLIVYIFECASCITSYTHRDYVSGEGGSRGRMMPGVVTVVVRASLELHSIRPVGSHP